MWQTKYASAVPKNLGVGVDFRPYSALWAEGGWKLKLTRVHATEYEIYGTKYLLV